MEVCPRLQVMRTMLCKAKEADLGLDALVSAYRVRIKAACGSLQEFLETIIICEAVHTARVHNDSLCALTDSSRTCDCAPYLRTAAGPVKTPQCQSHSLLLRCKARGLHSFEGGAQGRPILPGEHGAWHM